MLVKISDGKLKERYIQVWKREKREDWTRGVYRDAQQMSDEKCKRNITRKNGRNNLQMKT